MAAYSYSNWGAIAFHKSLTSLMFVAMFLIVYGILGNGLWNIVYCIMVKGYFLGIYTGLLNLLVAPVLIKRLGRMRNQTNGNLAATLHGKTEQILSIPH